MAKGFENHRERREALNQLGRTLARRSSSKCELCESSGVKLMAYEVPPLPEMPEADRCAFLCDECREGIERPTAGDPRRWRCLGTTVWSEVPAVQVTAVRLLRELAGAKAGWAHELLETLYLSPEVEEWLAS